MERVVTTAPYLAQQNCGTLYEKLSIPGLDMSQFPKGIIGECYVADFRYSLVFSYNADKWPDPAKAPKTLADFFDTKKFPGKRGVVRAVQDGLLEQALLADGRPGRQDVSARRRAGAEEVGDHQGRHHLGREPGRAVAAHHLEAGRHAVSGAGPLAGCARCRRQHGSGVDVTVTSVDALSVPKGSPHLDEIQKFLSFVMQPEPQARMATLAGIGASNLKAVPTYTANGNKVNAFGPANTGKTPAGRLRLVEQELQPDRRALHRVAEHLSHETGVIGETIMPHNQERR